MSLFPIFKLPLLARQRAIELATPADIFHFSLCSTKCRQFVQMTKPRIQKISWIFESMANGVIIQIGRIRFDIMIFEGYGPLNRNFHLEPIWDLRAIRLPSQFLGQAPLFSRRYLETIEVEFRVGDSESREALFKLLIAYLRSIYTCQTYHLGYWADPTDPQLLTHFFPIRTLTFEYSEALHNKIFYFLRLEAGKIDNLRLERNRNLTNEQLNRDVFNKLLHFRSMDLGFAPWFSIRNISDFVNLKAQNPNLTSSDVNQILQQWNSGGHRHLESMAFYQQEAFWNKQKILEGLRVVDVENERRVEIVQRNDGLKARIYCNERQFAMLILHPGISRDKIVKCCFWHMIGDENTFHNYLKVS